MFNTRGEKIGAVDPLTLRAVCQARARAVVGPVPEAWSPFVMPVEPIPGAPIAAETRARFTRIREEEFKGHTLGEIVSKWAHARYDDGREHVWFVGESADRTRLTIVPCGEGGLFMTLTDMHTFFHATTTFADGQSYHVHTHPSGSPGASEADAFALHGIRAVDDSVKGALIPMGPTRTWTEYEPQKPPPSIAEAMAKLAGAGARPAKPNDTDSGIDGGVILNTGRKQ